MTGLEFGNIFDLETDKAYSGYLDSTKKNRLFKKSIIESIERKYRENVNQKQADELSFLVSTNETFYTTNNQIYVKKLQITLASVATTTATITTAFVHNLTVGDSVTISGITGVGTFPTVTNITATVATVPTTTTFTYTVVATAGTYTAGGEVQVNGSKMAYNYEHLLAVKTYYTKSLGTAAVLAASTATITMATNNYNLRTGEYVLISGAVTNSTLNGFWFIKRLSNTRFQLYSNVGLTETITTLAEASVTIKRVFAEWCKPYWSDRKINIFETPTVIFPKAEEANGLLKFYPETETIYYIKMDYVRQPPIYIDVTNDIINLEDYYPIKFLYYIINVAKQMFAAETRDGQLYQTSSNDIIQNP